LIATRDGDIYRATSTFGMRPEWDSRVRDVEFRPDRNTITGRAALERRVVHVPDITADPEYGLPESAAIGGIRTNLGVPLLREGEPIGVIALARTRVEPFSERQIELVRTFADQAVIAMENARLLTETRESLERQTATAEVLQVINSSPGNVTPVFETILEKARALCGVAYGSLLLYDGVKFRAIALHGQPEPLASLLRDGYAPESNHPSSGLLAGEDYVHIRDIGDIDHPIARASIEGGIRTVLFVALRKDSKVLGVVVVSRKEVRPFADKEISLLRNFATQAVIAMENARLLTETREALDQQTATAEVLQVINSSPGDPAPVFDAMLERATRLCDAPSGLMWTTTGDRFHAVAIRGMSAEFVEFLRDPDNQPRMVASDLPIGRVVRGEPVVHVLDILAGEVAHELPTLIKLGGFRTVLALPLRNDAALLGAFVIGRREVRPFTERQIALLQNFAEQAVIAMENARLLGELRQRTEEVAELNRGLEARVAEQVEELGRVGRLKRFLAPQLAELIVSQGDEKILESHRREIVVVFCDLRGYTAFAETAEPEEVLNFLREYHGALGPLVSQFEGTLDQFSGDGIMVFFNDPVPIPDPAERAVKMAVAMREAASTLIAAWRERGRQLGFGVGIAQGYATLGQIGFSERSGYTAIGTVCNVAARLCGEAKDGQILLGQLVNVALKGSIATEQVGALALKGLTQPVVAYNVPLAASQPALRVIDGGSR
jgi:adenylate cyclase